MLIKVPAVLAVLIQAIVLASAGLLSVGSITLVILLLLSDQGWRTGLAYALGYTSAYTFIGILSVLLGYRSAGTGSEEAGLVQPILLVVLGTVLIWLALRTWRKPRTEGNDEPRFFSIVDKVNPPKAFGFGALVSVINFKNLALFMAAQSVVILSPEPLPNKIVITLLVVLVFCFSVIGPVAIYLSFPRRAQDLLLSIRRFLGLHRRTIGIWLPSIFGLLFIVRGLRELL